MNITINGKQNSFKEESLTITDLLKSEQVESPDMVSVQRNGLFVKKEDYDNTLLSDGDEVDFLYLMGGGAL